MARVASDSHQAARWAPESYQKFPGWVAEDNGDVIGFTVVRIAADEMEILNLAVVEAFRRHGVATRLLEAALEFGRASGVQRVFLEVRESNRPAQSFYLGAGFAFIGRRPGFYRDPDEAALLMRLTFAPAS